MLTHTAFQTNNNQPVQWQPDFWQYLLVQWENVSIYKAKKNNQQQSTCAPAVLQCSEGSCVGHYPHPETLFTVRLCLVVHIYKYKTRFRICKLACLGVTKVTLTFVRQENLQNRSFEMFSYQFTKPVVLVDCVELAP